MLLSDCCSTYLLFKETRASPTTITTDTILLNQFQRFAGADTEIECVTPQVVRDYLKHHKERGLSPHTIKRHLAVISAMFTWLTSDEVDITDSDPTDRVANIKLPRVKPKAFSREEVGRLVAAAQGGRNPRRDKAVVLFLVDTGARASELCGVTIADFGAETGKVLLRDTKGGDHRYVYLGRRARLAAHLYIKDERPDPAQSNNLFLTRASRSYGYPLDRHSVRSLIVRLGERAGVEGATTHRFRHTMATLSIQENLDPFRLMQLLGHRTLDVTLNYCRSLSDADVQKAVEGIAPSDLWKL